MKETEIPPKYQEHHQVFSEEGAKWLPPTRVEDMAITLKDDAPEQLDCKVYLLSRKELEVLRGSLNGDLAKGYIKTSLGTFIPTVMTFGFCNAPSIFQRAMNRDLEPLKQLYPNNFTNYMDDIAIGTDNTPQGQALHEHIVHQFLDILE